MTDAEYTGLISDLAEEHKANAILFRLAKAAGYPIVDGVIDADSDEVVANALARIIAVDAEQPAVMVRFDEPFFAPKVAAELAEVLAEQGGVLAVKQAEDGHFIGAMEFGVEAEGSPMVGGAAYGTGADVGMVLAAIHAQVRI